MGQLGRKHGQQGFTGMGWVVFLLLLAAVLSLGLRLGPHYIDYRTIQAVIDGMPKNLHAMDKREINELLEKRFKVNSLRDLPPKDVFKIERTKDKTTLQLDYEVREHIAFNVDAVLVFKRDFVY